MQDTLQSLEAIQEKIILVQQRIEQQKKEINDLLIEKELLNEQLQKTEALQAAQHTTIADLEAQVTALKLAQTANEEEETKKTEMKKMIANMIKEVDKCLVVVNVN
jgi:hypothetical protein